jgi:hypothetical protein
MKRMRRRKANFKRKKREVRNSQHGKNQKSIGPAPAVLLKWKILSGHDSSGEFFARHG